MEFERSCGGQYVFWWDDGTNWLDWIHTLNGMEDTQRTYHPTERIAPSTSKEHADELLRELRQSAMDRKPV